MPLEGINRKLYYKKKFGGDDQALKMYNNIKEVGKKNGIFFQFDKIIKTPNSFFSHKLLALGYKEGRQNEIIESIFYAYFIEGRDIGNINELVNIAEQFNINKHEASNYILSSKDRKGLLKEEIQAKNMGIKSVPCFIFNKKYVIFGAQEKKNFLDIFLHLTQ